MIDACVVVARAVHSYAVVGSRAHCVAICDGVCVWFGFFLSPFGRMRGPKLLAPV